MQAKSAENRKTPLRLQNPETFVAQKATWFDLLNFRIWRPLWCRCGFVSLRLYFLHKYNALTRKLIRPVHPNTSQDEIPIIARLKKKNMGVGFSLRSSGNSALPHSCGLQLAFISLTAEPETKCEWPLVTPSCLDHYSQRAQWGAIKRQQSCLEACWWFIPLVSHSTCTRLWRKIAQKYHWINDRFPERGSCCVALNLNLFILCRALSPLANIIKNIYMYSSNCWHWDKNPISFDTQINLGGLSDYCKLGIINLHSINSESDAFRKNVHLSEMLKWRPVSAEMVSKSVATKLSHSKKKHSDADWKKTNTKNLKSSRGWKKFFFSSSAWKNSNNMSVSLRRQRSLGSSRRPSRRNREEEQKEKCMCVCVGGLETAGLPDWHKHTLTSSQVSQICLSLPAQLLEDVKNKKLQFTGLIISVHNFCFVLFWAQISKDSKISLPAGTQLYKIRSTSLQLNSLNWFLGFLVHIFLFPPMSGDLRTAGGQQRDNKKDLKLTAQKITEWLRGFGWRPGEDVGKAQGSSALPWSCIDEASTLLIIRVRLVNWRLGKKSLFYLIHSLELFPSTKIPEHYLTCPSGKDRKQTLRPSCRATQPRRANQVSSPLTCSCSVHSWASCFFFCHN